MSKPTTLADAFPSLAPCACDPTTYTIGPYVTLTITAHDGETTARLHAASALGDWPDVCATAPEPVDAARGALAAGSHILVAAAAQASSELCRALYVLVQPPSAERLDAGSAERLRLLEAELKGASSLAGSACAVAKGSPKRVDHGGDRAPLVTVIRLDLC